MCQWQSQFEPQVQKALLQARQAVGQRGGESLSVEDFLLSLLDLPELPAFLYRQGVDLDELTRTIQCEQPLVAVPAAEEGLSAQLMQWFSLAREIHGSGCLSLWPLLEVLVHGCESLSEKAYVAVLEQIPRHRWHSFRVTPPDRSRLPEASDALFIPGPGPAAPLISERLLRCANRLIALVLGGQCTAVWLQCDHGGLARSILAQLQEALSLQAMAGSVECCSCSVSHWQLAGHCGDFSPRAALEQLQRLPPAPRLLVLDGVTPELWRARIEKDGLWHWHRLLAAPGLTLVLRSASAGEGHERACHWLASQFDRPVSRLAVPDATVADLRARLHFEHAALESQLGLEIESAALDAVAEAVIRPGGAEEDRTEKAVDAAAAERLLAGAAAALGWEQRCGTVAMQSLRNRCRSARQRELVSLARDEPLPEGEEPGMLALWRTAEEVSWRESVPATETLRLTARQLRDYVRCGIGERF